MFVPAGLVSYLLMAGRCLALTGGCLLMADGYLALAVVYLALAGGVVRVLRPTLADGCLWRVGSTALTPCLVDHRVGNREWGLRPRTPPPTEMGVVAHDGTAKGAERRREARSTRSVAGVVTFVPRQTANGQVVWVSGRRPHSRSPQKLCAG